jgi:pimeloyl-ACP methyl ester carboxylesterase
MIRRGGRMVRAAPVLPSAIATSDTRTVSLEAARAAAGAGSAWLSDGGTAYHVAGDRGPWVVLVHGLLRPGNTWEPLANALVQQGFRVLYYDAFGHGLSDRPVIRYQLDVYIRQLAQLTDELGIDAMHLIGWSAGGMIVTGFAAQYPTRVTSLTLVAPALYMGSPRWAWAQMLLRAPGISKLIAWRVGGRVDRVEGFDLSRPERFPDLAACVRAQMAFPGVEQAVASTLVYFPFAVPQQWRVVGEHARPVLVVWGDNDPVARFSTSSQVLGFFPRATLLRIEGARHAPHLDHAEIVHPAISYHLKDCG